MDTPQSSPRPMADAASRDLRIWPWAGLVFLGLAFLAMAFDARVMQWVETIELRGDMEGVLEVGQLFGHGIGVMFVLLAVAALDKERRCLLRLAACAYLAGLCATLGKVITARVRPIELPAEHLAGGWVGFIDPASIGLSDAGYHVQSMPSGHTTTAVGLAIGLCWRYPHARWLFVLLAVLTAAERVMTRAHYPSDTLAGAGLALLISGGFVNSHITGWLFDRFESEPKGEHNSISSP